MILPDKPQSPNINAMAGGPHQALCLVDKPLTADEAHRQLFSLDETMARVAEPDKRTRPGAELFRQIVGNVSGGGKD